MASTTTPVTKFTLAEANQTDRPLVVAVVLTWNDTEMAGRCVQSVLDNHYHPLRVIVVDNGSSTPCGEQLRRRFPSIEPLILRKNEGFTGGCNRGLERALELSGDYIFLLNNDTIVERTAIRQLVEALEQRPVVGAASAILLYPGVEKRVQFYTASIWRDRARDQRVGEGQFYEGRRWPIAETEFAPACALLFRASVLREVGLLDESLGTCWEDYDLCARFINAKRPLITVGSAQVIHDHGATTGRVSPYITYYFARNRLICLFRYGHPIGIARNALYILRSFWWQVKDYGLGNWPCHRAFAKAGLHFLIGISGNGSAPHDRRDGPRADKTESPRLVSLRVRKRPSTGR